MDKKEKEVVASYGQQWVDAIDRQTKQMAMLTTAVRYLADVIGVKGDAENPKDEQGKVQVTIEAEVKEPEQSVLTIEEVKKSLNTFARAQGKDKAFALLEKYTGSRELKNLRQDQYADIYQELTEAA